MKQLNKPKSTKPLKTPKMPDKHKTICKAFANPVLVALSFSIGFQSSKKQSFSQELKGLLSYSLITLEVERS